VVAHQTETDLKVGIAEVEPVSDQSKLLGIGIVVFLDAAIVGAAGNRQGVVNLLGVDFPVEKVAEQGF